MKKKYEFIRFIIRHFQDNMNSNVVPTNDEVNEAVVFYFQQTMPSLCYLLYEEGENYINSYLKQNIGQC